MVLCRKLKSNQVTRESKYKTRFAELSLELNSRMKLSSAFQALKQTDFEKTEILMDKPLIRFSPDVSRIQKSSKHSIELRVDPADEADLQTYKYPYLVFEDGTVEDLLLWKNQVEEVIQRQNSQW